MRKKSLFKIFILTPLIAIFLTSASFLIIDYPGTLASVELMLDEWKSPAVITCEHTKCDHTELESRIRDSIINDPRLNLNRLIAPNTAQQILSSTVKILHGGSSGTGITIFENKVDGYHYTYVITNYHVVGTNKEVSILRYTYLRDAAINSTINYSGKVVKTSPSLDLALIEIKTAESIGTMAKFENNELESNLILYQNVFIVGCPLGNPPMISNGNVAYISDVRNMLVGFSIFGSSGGGVFNADGRLVGMVRGVPMIEMSEELNIPESNITLSIPGTMIKSWIIVEGLSFLLGEGGHENFLKRQKLRPRVTKK